MIEKLMSNHHCKLHKSNPSWMMVIPKKPQTLNLH